jgi:hypothetical protein
MRERTAFVPKEEGRFVSGLSCPLLWVQSVARITPSENFTTIMPLIFGNVKRIETPE